LNYSEPYELIIAARLSAQCTDKRVNMVTAVLFEKYKTLQSLAEADIADIENFIKPCGLFRTKAQNIKALCQVLYLDRNGVIPDSIEELTKLPGIGRKTANLIMGDIFHKPAYVCDTHCIRIAGRLGLTASTDPVRVEADLRGVLPPDKSSDFCHRIVMFGRDFCKAQNPKCESCELIKMIHHEYPEFECRKG
jgi:endonuclease-3